MFLYGGDGIVVTMSSTELNVINRHDLLEKSTVWVIVVRPGLISL